MKCVKANMTENSLFRTHHVVIGLFVSFLRCSFLCRESASLQNLEYFCVKSTIVLRQLVIKLLGWRHVIIAVYCYTSALTHWGRDKMDAISQTTVSSAFSYMKMYELRLKFQWRLFLKGPINNIPALVQIMAWRRPGDKPLSEPMMVRLPTHICDTRPQWVKTSPVSVISLDFTIKL